MDPSATAAIISGQQYVVEAVNGKVPTDLEDFTGEASFVVSHGAQQHEVLGVGRIRDGVAAFHEKSGSVAGKDVRVWTITTNGGAFAAEHAPQLPA